MNIKRCLVPLIWGILALIIVVTEVTATDLIQGDQTWKERDLLKTGQALSLGVTLIKPITPILEPPPPVPPLKTMEDFGFNSSAMNSEALRAKAVGDCAMTTIDQAITASSVAGAGAGVMLSNILITGKNFWDAWKVGTGQADPNILRSTIPHVIQSWDLLKGPQNLSTQTFTPQDSFRTDGAWRIKSSFRKIIHTSFSSSTPAIISRYGYDPYTDHLVRTTTIRSVTHESFSGADFNRSYKEYMQRTMPPAPPAIPPMQGYIPPAPIATQPLPKTYDLPSQPINSFNQPIYSPPSYTPLPTFNTQPMIIPPAPIISPTFQR